MNDDDRWRSSEAADRGPSAPNTLRFDPLASAIGVFFAIAVPIFVVGYTRPNGVDATIIAIGVIAGLLAAVLVGIWVAHRDGRIWRDPRV